MANEVRWELRKVGDSVPLFFFTMPKNSTMRLPLPDGFAAVGYPDGYEWVSFESNCVVAQHPAYGALDGLVFVDP
jgi:hypothetical protein